MRRAPSARRATPAASIGTPWSDSMASGGHPGLSATRISWLAAGSPSGAETYPRAAKPDGNSRLTTPRTSGTKSQNVDNNMRLRWTIQPGNDLFIVWNRGWQRLLLSPMDWALSRTRTCWPSSGDGPSGDMHSFFYGRVDNGTGSPFSGSADNGCLGFFWCNLRTTNINVQRMYEDGWAQYVNVRLWVLPVRVYWPTVRR